MAKKPRVPGFAGVMLAQTYDPTKHDVTEWVASEKLDGVRAFWDGKQLISRTGVAFTAPRWFIKGFPKHPMDGELFLGRGRFQDTSSIVRTEDDSNLKWMSLTYRVFEVPGYHINRVSRLDETEYLKPIQFWTVPYNKNWIPRKFKEVTDSGGEGLMFRNPNVLYEVKRSWALLKMKPEDEIDAVVVGTTAGKGRHKNRIGALSVESGTMSFEVGSGLTDEQRSEHWTIGTVIRVGHMGFTDDGIPRFPTFKGIRGEQYE
jgi:DNA ligase-1